MGKYEHTIGKEVDLKAEQEKTLLTPRLGVNFILKGMIITMDLVYGRARTLPKFLVLEILARYPYWAWETRSYKILSKYFAKNKKSKKEDIDVLLNTIKLGRDSQDNEQCHMLLLSDIIQQKGIQPGCIKRYFIPTIMAAAYYYLTKIIYAINPASSFTMNAAFESHAENQYMLMAKENPQWDTEQIESVYFAYYPKQKSLGDLIRRIGLDERDHMNSSLEELDRLAATHA